MAFSLLKKAIHIALVCSVCFLTSCSLIHQEELQYMTPELEAFMEVYTKGDVMYTGKPSPASDNASGLEGVEYYEEESNPFSVSSYAGFFEHPETVSLAETPLLWDFVNGCLDWHVSLQRDLIDSSLYALRNLNEPNILFVDQYIVQTDFTLPPISSQVEVIRLTDDELLIYNKALEQLPKAYIITDGDWELCILDDRMQETGITFWHSAMYITGNLPPFLKAETGWPTEWLRRAPYAMNLTRRSIDISDSWWDEWRYKEKCPFLPTDASEDQDFQATVVCEGVQQFSYQDNTMTNSEQLTWLQLLALCQDGGYIIPGHLDTTVNVIDVP